MRSTDTYNHTKLEEFEQLCRDQGVSVTVQRRAVLQSLLDRDDHPTADQVLDSVQKRMPEVSRATVYRVLETLVRLGMTQKIAHPGGVVRFDPKTERHHHLVCGQCQQVIDVEEEDLNPLYVPKVRRDDFEISDYSVVFHGVCTECGVQTQTVTGV